MNIIIDTREQQPWGFMQTNMEVVYKKLDTGDYSLGGYEDLLSIERKQSVSEIAGNITKKRFWRMCERLQRFRWKFLLLEFTYQQIENYPYNLSLSKRIRNKIRIRGPFIFKELTRIQEEYGIPVVLCGNAKRGEEMAISIFECVLQKDI